MNVIARSLTVFLYASVWSINWTVYGFHVRATRYVFNTRILQAFRVYYKPAFQHIWQLKNKPDFFREDKIFRED